MCVTVHVTVLTGEPLRYIVAGLTFEHPVARVPVEVNAAFPESWSAKLLNLIETD